MLVTILFPQNALLQLEGFERQEAGVIIQLSTLTSTAICPVCQQESNRVHSCYYRYPADLPCMGLPVRLQIQVRRFFCHNRRCKKRTFAERLQQLLQPRKRRTERLVTALTQMSYEISAESGSRLASRWGILTSSDSLTRLIRAAPEPDTPTPRVLGVDDWAKRKGQTYGTILIDLETRQVVDLLPERSAQALADWLQEHPGVEIISRDRGPDYIKGATMGAPNAIQVADRWHLLKNLREAVEEWLLDKPECLKVAAAEPETPRPDAVAVETQQEKEDENLMPIEAANPAPVAALSKTEARKQARRARKQKRFDLVHALRQQGYSEREIGRQTKISKGVVSKYLKKEQCAFYPENVRRGSSKLAPYQVYLEKLWQAGHHNATELWREICQQGFDGSRGLVAKWATQQRRLLSKKDQKHKKGKIMALPTPKKVTPWSAKRASWLLVKNEAEIDEAEKQALQRMQLAEATVASVHQLVQRFQQMVREKQAEELVLWLDDVKDSGVGPLITLARGILQDFDAVKNALSLPWSNGQTEGQVNRLKFIKRQMFGRANFDLLRRRVLGRSTCPG